MFFDNSPAFRLGPDADLTLRTAIEAARTLRQSCNLEPEEPTAAQSFVSMALE